MSGPARKPNPLDALPAVEIPKQAVRQHPARSGTRDAQPGERIVRGSLHLPYSLDGELRALVTRLRAAHRVDKAKVLRAMIEELLDDADLQARVAARLPRA